MARLTDGPLGPKLTELGFKRLGDLDDPEPESSPRSAEDRLVLGATYSLIATKRRDLPELPIFARVGGGIAVTIFVDIQGQIWFADSLIDLTEIGIDEYSDLPP